MRKSVLIVSLGVVALGCAAVIAVPDWIQHKAIDAAAAQGVKLQIGSTHLGLGGIGFEDSNATTVRMPNAKIHIDEITTNWNIDSITVNGADVTIDGAPNFPSPSAPDNPVPNPSGVPIHVASAHISWTHAFGDLGVDVSNISGDYESTSHGGDTYTCTGDTTMSFAGKTIGPFATQFESSRGSSNRIVFSRDAGSANSEALVVDFSPGFSNVDLQINARPLSKIGVPLELLGAPKLAADPTVNLHFVDHVQRLGSAPAHANGLVSFQLDAIPISGLPDPAAVSIDLAWSGSPDDAMPIDAKQSKLSVGPFSGPITGTLSRPQGAIALNLATESNAVPCTKFSASYPMQSTVMGAFAAMTGVKSDVVGDVKIDGSLQFDSRNPGDRRLSVVPNNTCGVSISLGSGGK